MTRIILLSLVMLIGCKSAENYYRSDHKNLSEAAIPDSLKIAHTFYLIGDAGLPPVDSLESPLYMLRQMLEASDQKNTSVVFLGDNIYPSGLHKKKSKNRENDERAIQAQMDILQDFHGKIVFIPGNHDWKEGKPKGDQYIKRQEKYVEKYLDRGNTFLPDGGCPGPVEIEINDRLLWVIIDTQWWLHAYDKPAGDQDDCDVSNREEYLLQIEDVLKKNRNKQIIISGHHPLYSNGNHGGYFSPSDHIFPLTNLKPNLYIPLPIIGSIYPLYRTLLGDIQDIPHHDYKALIQGLTNLFDQYEDVVYTSGHEHNLQYRPYGKTHYVVSGSGSKSSYLRGNTNIAYGTDQKGFAVLKSFENGDLWLEFFVPEMRDVNGGLTFRKKIRSGHRILDISEKAVLNLAHTDSSVTVVPGGQYYKAGPVKKIIMGDLYRDVWTSPIDVPIIDISKEHGGLVPTKRGGGMQSKSLRLEAPDGKEYVLRSVQKFPAGILPKELRATFASEVIQDVIAASHPYASIVVPPLADAAGVFHTNPKLVYVPDDPALGQFRQEFGNLLCLYEERPDNDQSDMASFGYSKDVVSSPKMQEELRESYKDQVDQKAMLRARLFDLLIGDWDRHDDQWRWASFEEDNKTVYRPIPRDRDQAFYSVNGLVPNIVNRKWLQRRFQPFKEDIRDMAGMNFNGQYVDRAYLTGLEWSDWEAVCDTLQLRMTDQVFKDALAHFPDTAYAPDGERIFKTLQIHREKLKEFAREYYLILAEEVDVVGSYKDEYFEVIRHDDSRTEVNVYPKKKKNKKDIENRIYHRVFLTSETDEIRIYGLDGEDIYVISGNVNKGPVVRLIGGSKTDKYINDSNVKGWKNKLQIYDTREKKKKKRNKTKLGKDSRIQLTEDDDYAVEYNRKAFQYDWLAPVVALGYNPDDGVFLGGGLHIKKYGFNKFPYKYRQKFKGSYAIATGAFQFKYEFDYRSIFQSKWNFDGELEVRAPDYLFNFFGLGNETEINTGGANNNGIRLNFVNIDPGLSLSAEDDIHRLRFSPVLQFVLPPDELEKGIYDRLPGIEGKLDFKERFYAGIKGGYYLENLDDQIDPQRGIKFKAEASWIKGVNDSEVDFTRLNSEVTFFFPFSILPDRTTLALRSGVKANFGKSRFYQANFLGGYSELRGNRRNRYAGDVAFYNNAELRVRVFDFNNYILPFSIGALGFFDIGRVWVDGEDSDIWHSSAGGGIYFKFIDSIIVSTSYGKSEDDGVFTLNLGFLF